MSFPAISDYEIPDDDYNKTERSRVVNETIAAFHARARQDRHHGTGATALFSSYLANRKARP